MRFRTVPFVALATALFVGTIAVPANAAPTAPRAYTAPIEAYAPYSPQSICSPTAKPGVVAWRDQLLRTYSWTRSLGIVRACDVGGRSEHKEGRALDWGVNVSSARDVAAVRDVFAWLFATDKYGNKHAMARRLGIQYIIWNRQIWGSYSASQGWRAYTGASPHTDHVHFSFSWPGANKVTSYWDGTVADVGGSAPTSGGGGSDGGGVVMPNDDAVGEPLPPASLLQSTTPTVDERLWFDATRSGGVTTRTSLQRGTPYMVEVRGQYSYRTAAYADAECSRASGTTTWVRSRSLSTADRDADHLDVYLNGIDGRFVSDGPDQCDTANHTYRWTYVPERTGRANFRIWDTSFRDNRGGLNIRIAKLSTDDSDRQWMTYGAEAIGNTGLVRYRDGVDYVVEVRGVYQYGAGGTYPADAECVPSGDRWRRSYPNGNDVVGVLLNGDDLSGQALVDNGARCDETTHTYRYLWTPRRDTTLTTKLYDTRYTDNSGRLQVRVVRADLAGRLPAPPPLPPEVLSVDSRDDNGVPTARAYAGGTTYEVKVTGVYDAGAGVSSDAECTATTGDPTWRDRRTSTLSSRLLWDLTVNGRTQDWVPVSGSGPCSATHEYTVRFTPDNNGQIRFGVRDATFSDNSGALSVTITKV
ncbi:MAG TPA: hypothetical protein VGX28_00285 [Frankiaceae bacterium]|nr:hypothetical protein [Frankiaceae bacterium]